MQAAAKSPPLVAFLLQFPTTRRLPTLRPLRELEAEATAYVVMRHFEIEHVASNYLATYDVDGAQPRESLETISNAAKRLIAVIKGNQQDTGAAETAASPGREEAA